jgi:hypothetical protein
MFLEPLVHVEAEVLMRQALAGMLWSKQRFDRMRRTSFIAPSRRSVSAKMRLSFEAYCFFAEK